MMMRSPLDAFVEAALIVRHEADMDRQSFASFPIGETKKGPPACASCNAIIDIPTNAMATSTPTSSCFDIVVITSYGHAVMKLVPAGDSGPTGAVVVYKDSISWSDWLDTETNHP